MSKEKCIYIIIILATFLVFGALGAAFSRITDNFEKLSKEVRADPPPEIIVNVPEIKIPEIKVPETIVNVPEIKIPEIKVPETTVNVPEIETTVKSSKEPVQVIVLLHLPGVKKKEDMPMSSRYLVWTEDGELLPPPKDVIEKLLQGQEEEE